MELTLQVEEQGLRPLADLSPRPNLPTLTFHSMEAVRLHLSPAVLYPL